MAAARPERVLLHFQLRSGARVASRTLAPLAAGFTAATVIAGSPLVVLSPIAYVLFPPMPATMPAVWATCVLGLTATALAPRLKPGLTGWIRHLPASSKSRRRAAAVGLAIASLPVLTLVLAGGATMFQRAPIPTAWRLLGIPILALAAAHASLPVGPRSRLVGLLGAVFSFTGSPWFLIGGVASLAIADRIAHDTFFEGTKRTTRRTGVRLQGALLWVTVSLRSLGPRIFVFSLASLMVLVPLLFFVSNNGLTESQSHIAIRFAGLVAAVFVTAAIADGLAKRRPPWPWIRSLPWSARRRVGLDALILGIAAFPGLLAAGLIRPATLPSMVVVLPFVAIRAAAAVRAAPERSSGAAGQLMAEGFLAAAGTAVQPLLALLAIPAAHMALKSAVNAEKEQDVSRWHELHHLAAGDTTSWSDS